jgi:acetylornithine deacetylase/succinyl-diaminopimelate desuccinylase-like protein
METMLDRVLERIDAGLPASLDRLFALLRIESISTDPAYRASVRSAAEWLAHELSALGFTAAVRETPGHPIVVAHDGAAEKQPHVLFYGHYDVQPVDPLNLWETPPFAPRVVTRPDGTKQIVARGAGDDKGQLMTFVEACRAWKEAAGSLPVAITVLLEGEEESGSVNLPPFLKANRSELAADLALVCDTGMWDRETPAITTMLRGLVGEEVTIVAADKDLHSGLFGGAARNPIHVLVEILAGLHNANGRVTLPGFYDGVGELPAEIRAQWAELGFDASEFLGSVGLSLPAGETDRSVLEQLWARPTAEVNGIVGGYTGAGFKTVIASKASAKVSFRLVGDQDPAKISAAFQAFVRSRIPADCRVEFISHAGKPAVRLPLDGPYLSRARKALFDEWGRDAALVGGGGSIPVVGEFRRILGLESLMIGFGLDDDGIHSPNEKYDLTSFHRGIRSWARVLGALAG